MTEQTERTKFENELLAALWKLTSVTQSVIGSMDEDALAAWSEARDLIAKASRSHQEPSR
jgi:hypothetical protein